ncbi:MAG: hypothetical protein ACYDAQ_13395 [Mycobacteriales bacterium]
MTPVRALLLTRLGTGALFFVCPCAGLRLLGYHHNTRTARTVVRLLGLRHLVQSCCEATGDPHVLRAGATVDLLHAASALSFAQLSRTGRHAGRRSATLASTLAVCQLWVAKRTVRCTHQSQERG